MNEGEPSDDRINFTLTLAHFDNSYAQEVSKPSKTLESTYKKEDIHLIKIHTLFT